MKTTHTFASRKQVIASELRGPQRLFATAPFFSPFKLMKCHDGDSDEHVPINPTLRLESLSFLSQLFDLVTAFIDPTLAQRSGPKMAEIVRDVESAGFTKEYIKIFRQQIGCAHMSLKMMS